MLSKKELLEKFQFLKKFDNQIWLSEESIKEDCNYKKIPMIISFELIKSLTKFIDDTKFNSRWEEGFSIKIRLQQIEQLLEFFCEDTLQEKSLKGSNLHLPPDTIHD